jgi:hypothetical protein
MGHIPVSIGIPALVLKKRSHVVSLVDERRIELFRRIPYIVVFIALVIANLAYVGAPPFAGLGNRIGYALIANGTVLVLAATMLTIGRRVRFDKDQMAEAEIVFLPEWTYAMFLGALAALVSLLT